VTEPGPTAVKPSRLRLKSAFAVLVSVGLLAVLITRLEPGDLAAALGRLGIGEAGMLFALFGLAIACTGWRWRIGLRLARVPLDGLPLARAVLGGHVLNMVLFGPLGGDLAKSAGWARWYGIPLSDLLAACILDRTLAAWAAVAVGMLTVLLVWLGGIPVQAETGPSSDWGGWLLGGLIFVLIVGGVFYRFRRLAFFRRLARSLRSTVQAALAQPGALVRGTLLGLLAQVLMSLTMGLALWSVTTAPVDWVAVAWTFPIITAVAALPTSFGGAGVREAVAVVLLSRYGIPAADLVAAGLVYLLVQVAWAIFGALLLAWEERRFLAQA
jgi:uncharacterized membrane protein YbhN (UPF0104 family)